MTLKDNESGYSSSSSLTSTSSKLSKIVKNMIQRKSSHCDLPTHKRSTIHFSFLFPRKQESPVELNKSKSLLVKSKRRRNSVINLASRFLQQASATKPNTTDDDVWVRQRTRSCQDQSSNDNNTSFLELHTRLLNDYNSARLSNKITLLFDLHKLIDMVTWDTQQAKEKVIQEINLLLLNTSMTAVKRILDQCLSQYMSLLIDHKDNEAHWFRTYFCNDESSSTFFGYSKENNAPVLISIKKENNSHQQIRLICRTTNKQDERKFMQLPVVDEKTISTTVNMSFNQIVKMDQELLVSSGLQDEILRLDEFSLHSKYKFGVLLIKEGQNKEEEWFSNEHNSPLFENFLNIIGRKTKLQGYEGWAAGLDTKSGDSGEYIYVNAWKDNQVAYHVSTLIPSKPGDEQQIQRKRHIGNDIVCIVFIEGSQHFDPAAIKSQFLHVFIIVRYNENLSGWHVDVVSIEGVPEFGPPLPPHIFVDEKDLESFILAKLINAEYAAFKSPKFAIPINRARESILSSLVEKGIKIVSSGALANDSDMKMIPLKSSPSNSSTSSSSPPIMPAVSRSANMIRELSGNILSLARRKSTHDLSEKVADYRAKKSSNTTKQGLTRTAKKSKSEQGLLSQVASKKSLKNRIITSFNGLELHDTPNHSSRTSIISHTST